MLRNLNWKGKIVISKHGLKQTQLNKNNKFVQIANDLKIELQKLKIPKSTINKDYWKYEREG